jgi:hypothetical protein
MGMISLLGKASTPLGTSMEPVVRLTITYLNFNRLLVLVLLILVLEMDNFMNIYVFGVCILKENNVRRLFGLILNQMVGLKLF